MSVLEIAGVSVDYWTERGPLRAVDDVSLSVERGEIVGIVGESGCGKTTLAMAILRLVRPPGKIVAGAVSLEGENLFIRPRASMRHVRGDRLALVPQAAMNALDPAYRARDLVAEVIRAHRDVPRRQARADAARLLRSLGIPERQVDSYPHEMSGGMRQRVTIAMALANDPLLVVADEPVTGLDVIVQAQILRLLRDLAAERGLSMIFISHDILAVSKICHRLAVMYGGRIVEVGPAAGIVNDPRHPYTQGLLAAFPTLDGPRDATGIAGEVVDLAHRPPGCLFAPRCPERFERCGERPELTTLEGGRAMACHLAER
jgi:peptide/nickel transport system ATP-binding protein